MKRIEVAGRSIRFTSEHANLGIRSVGRGLTLNPQNFEQLEVLEQANGARIFNKTIAYLDTELPVVQFRQIRYIDGKRSRSLTDTSFLREGNTLIRTAPGANTPTCTDFDLKDLIENLPTYRAAGFNHIAFLLTADSIDTNHKWIKDALLKADWIKEDEKKDPDIVTKHITIITDPSKILTNFLGLLFESPELGFVPKRAAAIFREGKLVDIACQEKAADYDLVLANNVIARMNNKKPKLTSKI